MNRSVKERYTAAKRALFDKVYESLNDKQREAVFSIKKPLLVLAGAGSGKTTVLVKRIEYIIKYGDAYYSEDVPEGMTENTVEVLESAVNFPIESIKEILAEFIDKPCAPWKIVAITFTNKAANEIKSRLTSSLGDENIAKQIWAGTFHSICLRILRSYGDRLGYRAGFTVYDTEDSKKTIAASMRDLNIDEKQLPLKSVMSQISSAKNSLVSPDEFESQAGKDFRMKQIAAIYAKYSERLMASNAVDFDDIIMKTVELLERFDDIRCMYQSKFEYICVDEYQDTNHAQFVLTSLLVGRDRNIMVVGDDDQSIYRFRGATIENILSFDKTYPDAKVIKLEQNYRSTQNILDAANSVISNNKGRKGKELWTSHGEGEKIHFKKAEDQNAEARYIVDTINNAVGSGERHYRDFAVLYRVNSQSNSIESVFAKSGVPYRMLGGQRFTDRKEIRDVVAYLQLINNHNDRERLLRIINEPKRKLGAKTLEAIEQIADEQGCSMFDVIEHADKYMALAKTAHVLMAFADMINDLTKMSNEGTPLDVLVNQMLDKSGYRKMLKDAGEAEAERLDNIEEFISGVIEYKNTNEEPTLTGFLEQTSLVADVDRYDESADAVVMMTVHSAKGLEFPVVFLPGMEDGIFPGMQSLMSPAETEEERRLAYVAITRAKEKLYIVTANTRLLYGRTMYNPPSRFVSEIPSKIIKREDHDLRKPFEDGRRTEGAGAYYYDSPQTRDSNYYSGYSSNNSYIVGDKITVNKPLVKPSKSTAEKFSEGDRVVHNVFGEGDILSVKPMGNDTLYEIIFDTVGTKKLLGNYAKIRKK